MNRRRFLSTCARTAASALVGTAAFEALAQRAGAAGCGTPVAVRQD
jgi:hypothetical protein